MINQKEIIFKFSRLIGIPEYEARFGFEVFVKKILSKLNFGDQLEIESLGFFSVRKIKTNSSPAYEFKPAVIFSTDKLTKTSKDFLFFFPPEESFMEYPDVDSYLNVSFGKPLITSDKAVGKDLLLHFSGNEITTLIESKAERLVEKGKVYVSTEEQDQEFLIIQKLETVVQSSIEDDNVTVQKTEEVEYILNERVLSSSDNETELIQEKVEQREDTINKEFLQSSDKESEVIKKEAEEDSVVINHHKIFKTFNDFELVEPEEITPYEVESGEVEDKSKMFFDDLKLEEEDQGLDQNIETKNGYDVVTDNLLKATISEREEIDSGLVKVDEVKVRKRRFRMYVYMFFGLLIIGAAAVGTYLNFDQLKQIINNYIGEQPQTISVVHKITPKIISRTYEIPVSFSIEKNDSSLNVFDDSLLISPNVYYVKQKKLNETFNLAHTDQVNVPLNFNDMSEVARNIYQNGSEFIVQVSLWEIKSEAVKEMNRYIDRGYSCELIEESFEDINKYYRVIIRGFNSIDEASNFLIWNK